MAGGFRFTLGPSRTGGPPELPIDGEPTGADLRADDVEHIVSTTAAHPGCVRSSSTNSAGSPRAAPSWRAATSDRWSFPTPTSIYLDARADVRVERRELEREGADGVADALERRDRRDAR